MTSMYVHCKSKTRVSRSCFVSSIIATPYQSAVFHTDSLPSLETASLATPTLQLHSRPYSPALTQRKTLPAQCSVDRCNALILCRQGDRASQLGSKVKSHSRARAYVRVCERSCTAARAMMMDVANGTDEDERTRLCSNIQEEARDPRQRASIQPRRPALPRAQAPRRVTVVNEHDASAQRSRYSKPVHNTYSHGAFVNTLDMSSSGEFISIEVSMAC